MKKGYHKYDEVFKGEVLKQLQTQRSVSEIAIEYGVSESLLYRWKQELSASVPSAEQEELKRLRKRQRELEEENEILKKALKIFSQDG